MAITFSSNDLICNDSEMLDALSKVVYKGLTIQSSWSGPTYTINLVIKMRDKHAYVDCVRGSYIFKDEVRNLQVNMNQYSVNNRDIALRWLREASTVDVEMPFTIDLNLVEPEVRDISTIGNNLSTIWDILWNRYGGEMPSCDVRWHINDGVLSINSIRNDKLLINFTRMLQNSIEVTLHSNRATYYYVKASNPCSIEIRGAAEAIEEFTNELKIGDRTKKAR